MTASRMAEEAYVSSIHRGQEQVAQLTDRVRINIDHLMFELAAMMSATAVAATLLFVGMTLERYSHRPLRGAKSTNYTSIPVVPSVDAPIHYI